MIGACTQRHSVPAGNIVSHANAALKAAAMQRQQQQRPHLECVATDGLHCSCCGSKSAGISYSALPRMLSHSSTVLGGLACWCGNHHRKAPSQLG
jgi:hypothetical protein